MASPKTAEVELLRAELEALRGQLVEAYDGTSATVERLRQQQEGITELEARPSSAEVLPEAATAAGELAEEFRGSGEEMAEGREGAAALRANLARQEADTGTDYAVHANGKVLDIRSDHGDPYRTSFNRTDTASRVDRYRDCWPDAVMVQRAAHYGPWRSTDAGVVDDQ
ncbi:hypothetical protein [Streptomyces sp. NPDC007083]|uniref:hypothetical protein n=1 Tax=Streptomyces sp. NPDC007083 TaxID=3156913 RepID=UPI0033FAE07C